MKESVQLSSLLRNKKWISRLKPFLSTKDWESIEINLQAAWKENKNIFPDRDDIFKAFNESSPEEVKVVILGQDPYHGPSQADGLAFSVSKTKAPPPSLKNIFKAIEQTTGKASQCVDGDLHPWIKQGVFLLNSTLTVQESRANSHQSFGWEKFTDFVISQLSETKGPKVFILWGAFAAKKKKLIKNKEHLILTCVHPSPLSAYRGFFDSQQFVICNQFLAEKGLKPIIW